MMKKLIDALLRLDATCLKQLCECLLPLILIYKQTYQSYIEMKLTCTTEEDEIIK